MSVETNNLPCPFCGKDNAVEWLERYICSEGHLHIAIIITCDCGANAPKEVWNQRITERLH